MRRTWLLDLLEATRTLERQVSLLLLDAGLTLGQFRALCHLDGREACPAHTLSERLGITKPSATNLIQELRGLDLVSTEPHPDDGRSMLIRRTHHGSERLRIAFRNLAAMERALQTTLPGGVIDTLHGIASQNAARQTVKRTRGGRLRALLRAHI
ncbi:MAG: MarR family winged helix-turn-helix transcriptional regulator [Acidiferrobacteraceae bacterium]